MLEFFYGEKYLGFSKMEDTMFFRVIIDDGEIWIVFFFICFFVVVLEVRKFKIRRIFFV